MDLFCTPVLIADNLRRLMARDGLTVEMLIDRTRLNRRTIKSLLQGRATRPHAKTLNRLATGLDVCVDELFQNPSTLAQRQFDRQTNPAVDELAARQPQLFAGWTREDFDELYSRVGTGGALTITGARQVAEAMNHKRQLQAKISLLLESSEADLLESLVEALYRRVLVDDDTQTMTDDAPISSSTFSTTIGSS